MKPSPVALPDWPALMATRTAAAYLQVSESTFRQAMGRAGILPAGLLGLAVTRWKKSDLDGLIARLPHRGDEEAANANGADLVTEEDEFAAALDRTRRRAGGDG